MFWKLPSLARSIRIILKGLLFILTIFFITAIHKTHNIREVKRFVASASKPSKHVYKISEVIGRSAKTRVSREESGSNEETNLVARIRPNVPRKKLDSCLTRKSNLKNRDCAFPSTITGEVCDCPPSTLKGHIGEVFLIREMEYFEDPTWNIRPGGEWLPDNCIAREKIAIVIPFKNRETHILTMLNVLHPLLHSQQIHYRIFIIDQVSGNTFNKGATFNAGITEILKISNFDCLILHDIDLLPEDDRNYYSCHKSPSHLSPRLDRHGYVWMRHGVTVGGVLAITPEHYRKINGYSNKYVGWGGEDDDFALRMKKRKLKINRPLAAISCFSSLHHKRDDSFPVNQQRLKILRAARRSNVTVFPEGFSTVSYNLKKIELNSLYTRIKISLNSTLTIR